MAARVDSEATANPLRVSSSPPTRHVADRPGVGGGAPRRTSRAADLRRAGAAPGPVFCLHHAGARPVLEPPCRLCGAGLDRPAGLRRARRLHAVCSYHHRRVRSVAGDPYRRARRRLAGRAHRARRLPAARRLFRHRHMGRRRGLPPHAGADEAARRRHRDLPRPGHHQFDARADLIHRRWGVRVSAARDIAAYWLALVLFAGTLALVHLLLRSRRGLALAAIRDSELAAESVGVDSFRTKLFVYVLAAFGTGMIGALIYFQKARISPDAAFSVLDWTAYVIFIVVIGGIGTIEGPIVGALVLYFLQDYLSSLGPWYLITLGGLAVVIMLTAPKGLWGFVAERFDLQLFPVRRNLVSRDGKA